MKKIVRKGFSLMEIMIVMLIIAGLATIIVPNITSGSDSAKLTRMQSDARNTMTMIQQKYVDYQDYSFLGTSEFEYKDETGNGLSEDNNNDKLEEVAISKDNQMILKQSENCSNGFYIYITNTDLEDKAVKFDSCTDAKIQVVEVKEILTPIDSLKADAEVFLSQVKDIQDYYFANVYASGKYITYTDSNGDGLSDTALKNGENLQISDGNIVDIKHYRSGSEDCFVMKSTNAELNKSLWYNSCNNTGTYIEVEEENYWW